MKKYLFFAASAVMVLASCTSDEIGTQDPTPGQPGTGETEAIAFGSMTKKAARANEHVGSVAAGMLDDNFVVMGVKGNGTFTGYGLTNEVFDHYNVNYFASSANTTQSNSNDWEYVNQPLGIKGIDTDADGQFDPLSGAAAQTIKYWDYSQTQYDYVGVSLGKGHDADGDPATTTDITYAQLSKIDYKNIGKAVSTGTPVYTLTGTAEELASAYIADLVTLYNRDNKSDYKNAVVTPKFRSLGTKVRIALYETVPGYAVGDVMFYQQKWVDAKPGSTTNGSATDTPALFTETAVFMPSTGDGKMEIYYPTVGYTNSPYDGDDSDYNKAHIVYTAAATGPATLDKVKTFGALNYSTTKENAETKHTGDVADDKFLGTSSTTATYAGNGSYDVVIPQGAGQNLQLRIKYTLYPIDGGHEKIVVDNACAVVPAQYADWQPNYAYTYIFKISDATNGSTGVDGDGEIVEGITPITFSAVVIDDEDGIQETITSVATPTFTTYMKGKIITTNDEYTAGDIYATVMDGTTAKNTGITLYVAAPKAGTGAVVTEKTAELAYKQGKTDPSSDTYDKTNVTMTQVYGGSAVAAVPGADGNDITVPAYKWTATSGTTYVLRYDNGTKTAYKVVKVQ